MWLRDMEFPMKAASSLVTLTSLCTDLQVVAKRQRSFLKDFFSFFVKSGESDNVHSVKREEKWNIKHMTHFGLSQQTLTIELKWSSL